MTDAKRGNATAADMAEAGHSAIDIISLAGGCVAAQRHKNSRIQLGMQLTADANQRDRERTMAPRRDVYLPAEAIVRSRLSATLATSIRSYRRYRKSSMTHSLQLRNST